MTETVHGTYSQYQAEVRYGKTPCEPCKNANRIYLRQWRLRKGATAVPVSELRDTLDRLVNTRDVLSAKVAELTAALDSATHAREQAEAERDAARAEVELLWDALDTWGDNTEGFNWGDAEERLGRDRDELSRLHNNSTIRQPKSELTDARAELAQLRPVVEAAIGFVTAWRSDYAEEDDELHRAEDAYAALELVTDTYRRDTPEGGTENG